MIEQTYKLSMIPFEEQVRRNYEIPIVPASQYDKTLRTLSFELYNGEDRFTIPAEAVVYIFGMKPDGNAFQYQMTVEDNVAKIAMQTQMTTVAGCVTCEIVLFKENTAGPRIGSANFKLMVEKCAVGDDAEFSRSDMPVIQTLIFGGMVGDVLVKDANGVKWNSESLSTGYMRYDQYDPDRTGTVNSARQANNAATVDGHTVARNVLADEYTNEQIDESFRSVREEISDLDSAAVKSVNSIQPDQNGNVQLSKANIGLGNVDNTSDADKPISSAAQEALNQKVDKVPGMGLTQNSFTDTEKEKLGALPTSEELTAELSEKVDKEAGKGLSQENFTSAEKSKLANIAAGAEVNVQSDWTETNQDSDAYIMHKPSIPSKTSDLTNDSGFVTDAAMQSALNQKVDKETGKGLSTNDFTSAEKTKLAGIEAGAQVNTITGVKGDAESAYRTGDVNITKENIGLGNVDNTSDMDKPISTATQSALDAKQNTLTFDTTPTAGSTNPVTSDGIATEISALNSNLSTKVSSVNAVTPDTNGNVTLNAEDIPADGVGPKDVSGNPIIVTDAVAENAQNLSVELEPIQSGSGVPSPTNIRPITGRTQVDVTRTGKNLCPPVTIGKNYSTTTGEEITTNNVASSVKFPFDKDKTYVFTKNCNVNAMFLAWDSEGNYVGRTTGNNVLSRVITKSIFTTIGEGTGDLDSIAKIAIRFYESSSSQDINDVTGAEYQVELGDTATAYEPYVTPQSVTVQLGQTVYGGTLDVTAGKLTVETANIASYNGETIGEPWWSSLDEYVEGTTPTTGAQVVYTLATPTTVSLTPAQIALLEGYNILTTDGDNLNLRYTGTVASNVQAEIDEFEESTRKIAGSLAMIETSPATANHAVGSYLMLNNRLCKVTAAIATGEQIIVGSNVQYTTVAEELTAILAQISA